LCQIIQENVNESFYRLKDKSCAAIRKQRTKSFVSKSFKERTKGKHYGSITMKKGSFDLDIWNKIRLKLLNEAGDVKENQEFYEELLYSMGATSGMFGTGVARYNEKQLYDRFRNSVVSPPYLEEDQNLLENLNFLQDFWQFAQLKSKLSKCWRMLILMLHINMLR
jgi:hypothetical protein